MFGLTKEQREQRKKIKGWSSDQKSRTKQEFKDQCDITSILKKAREFGMRQDPDRAWFGDVSNIGDFQGTLERLKNAQNRFVETVPSDIRKKFDNDPEKCFQYIQDPKNREESIKLGLIRPPEIEKVSKVEIVNKEPEKGSKTAEKP